MTRIFTIQRFFRLACLNSEVMLPINLKISLWLCASVLSEFALAQTVAPLRLPAPHLPIFPSRCARPLPPRDKPKRRR